MGFLKKTALFLALGITSLSIVFFLITSTEIGKRPLLFWISIFILFLASYASIYYTLKVYLKKKLKPLIGRMKYSKTKTGEQMDANNFSDLLGEFDASIAEWVHRKAEEIDVLKSNEAYRKEYIGNVSHELKTPLFNIQGYIDTLIDGGLRDDEINMKYLKRTEKNINRLIAIVKDLETISKLETGQLALEITPFDIVQLIQEVFDMHEIRAKRKKIELKFDKSYASPILVNADKKGILNVVGNLIINSIIYGKEHGFTIVGIQTYRNKISVSISDNGIGIEQRHLKRVFERFFRVDKSRSKIQGGTGLGLAIVKHTLEAHNQKIFVESKPNVGTTFTFTLQKA